MRSEKSFKARPSAFARATLEGEVVINLSALRVACSNCNLREACLPTGLTLKEIERLEDLVAARRRIKRGDALFRAGDRFEF